MTECVDWASLISSPVLMMIMGVGIILMGGGEVVALAMGGLMFAVGLCSLACVFCCWRKYIPFMAILTKAVTAVISRHPCLLAVGILGAIMSTLWTVCCAVAFTSIYFEYEDTLTTADCTASRFCS